MKLPLNQQMNWKQKFELESSDRYRRAAIYERKSDGLFRVECLTCDYEPYDNNDFEVFASYHYASYEKALETVEDFVLNG